MFMATDQPVVWFEEAGPDGSYRRPLPPAKDVVKAHEKFKRKFRRALKSGHEAIKIAKTEDELKQQIEDIRSWDSIRGGALESLDEASKARETHQDQRKYGGKRVGRGAQEFVSGFAQFLGAYSSILDIVRGAGGPYGEVGYQTLSILLIVVINKDNNDRKIMDLLDEIRKSFPRLENWSQIYPTQTMRGLVAMVYDQVTAFSRAAVEYFSHFWKRFVLAIIQPPSLGVDNIAASIHKNLAEINSEAMYGLHHRSQNIENEVVTSGAIIQQLKVQADEDTIAKKRMERTIDALLSSLSEQEKKFKAYVEEVKRKEQQEDEQRFRSFEDDLGAIYPSSESDIHKCRLSLVYTFPNNPSYSPHIPFTAYIQMNPELLESCPSYREWVSSVDSSLLFLSGRTAREGKKMPGLTHCWLSPAAIYIAEGLIKEDKKLAFYSGHPELQSKPSSAKQIISSIILQILKWKPQVLRDNGVQFHTAVLSDAWQDSRNEKVMVRAMIRLLCDLLAEVKDLGTAFIIIDRLDQCESEIRIVMDELAGLVGDATCRVKVAVIAETSYGRGEWRHEFLKEDDYALDRVFVHKGWNQERMTNQQISRGHWPLTWSNSIGSSVDITPVW